METAIQQIIDKINEITKENKSLKIKIKKIAQKLLNLTSIEKKKEIQ